MKILEGKKIAEKILKKIKRELYVKKSRPGLAVVLVGKDPASEIYVRLKSEKSQEVGINFSLVRFKGGESEKEIIEKINKLNGDLKINGIIVQLPLPKKYDTQKIIDSISLKKDVDGFSLKNKKLDPVFPKAIFELVKSCNVGLTDKKSLIIANSHIFGKEMTGILQKEKIESDYILFSEIEKNKRKIKKADILITATGRPGTIKGTMVKKGAIVIDGGISKKGKKILGDVDAKSMEKISGFLSPVPGGVGPVTIACLLRNVYLASKIK